MNTGDAFGPAKNNCNNAYGPAQTKLLYDAYGPATCKHSYVIVAYGPATLYTLRMVPQHDANA